MALPDAEGWLRALGPVTKTALSLSVALTAVAWIQPLGLGPQTFALDWPRILHHFQLWRLLTNLVYFGPFGFNWLMNVAFYTTYASKVEAQFSDRPADHATLLLFVGALLTLGGWAFKIRVLSRALLMAMVWIWCRTNEDVRVSFLGWPMSAPYLPWVLFLLNVAFGGNLVHDLLGILAGHLYVFLAVILPTTHGVHLLRTPGFLTALLPPAGYGYRRLPGQGRRVED